MSKRTVLFDRIAYKGGSDGKEQLYANKGDEVDLSGDELKRLEELGAVGSEEDLAKAQAAATTSATTGVSDVSDDDLAGMSVDEVATHLGQFPGDADRIDALENSRSKRRAGVDETLDKLRAAQT